MAELRFRLIEVEASGQEAGDVVKTLQQLLNGNGRSATEVIPAALAAPARAGRKLKQATALASSNGHANGNGVGHSSAALTIAERIRQFCAVAPHTRSDITAHLKAHGVDTDENRVNQHLYLLTRRGDLVEDEERGTWKGKR